MQPTCLGQPVTVVVSIHQPLGIGHARSRVWSAAHALGRGRHRQPFSGCCGLAVEPERHVQRQRLWLAASRSPSTPLRAASTCSRSGLSMWDVTVLPVSLGSSVDSAASTPCPTKPVMPCTLVHQAGDACRAARLAALSSSYRAQHGIGVRPRSRPSRPAWPGDPVAPQPASQTV